VVRRKEVGVALCLIVARCCPKSANTGQSVAATRGSRVSSQRSFLSSMRRFIRRSKVFQG
jgi:hypothetical protein